MEGSDSKPRAAAQGPRRRPVAAWDVLRFALGLVFLVLGAGLLLEGAVGALTGSGLYLGMEGVNRVLEFYVGLMSAVLAGLLFAGMQRAQPEALRADAGA